MVYEKEINTIEVKNLTKDYGEGRGIFDVSFKILPGECFGFLGPNGAGKSTTIRHLMGFSKPDSGECLINNLNPIKNHEEIFTEVGYLPGEIALPNNFKGEEFFNYQAKLKKVKDLSYAKKIVERFKINLDLNCKDMSLGMKRRLAILTCFINNPKVLILDEPTSGLDLEMQQEFLKLIGEKKKENATILFSSHLFNEVRDSCNRVAIIKEGKIVSTFTGEEYALPTSQKFNIKLKNYKDFLTFSRLSNKIGTILFKDSEELNLTIKVELENEPKFINLLAKYDLADFNEIKETLEEKFLSYYDKN